MSADAQPSSALTPRQEEVRVMLRQGMSNKMIAGVLGISEGTVKNHVTEILRVLNANNRTQAAQQDKSQLYDAEEYLHLAMHAAAAGNVHACMTCLKELLQSQPSHAVALYLLACQHAEIGLYERAIKGVRAAVALDPTLELARFQLGLLLLDRGRLPEAGEQFTLLLGVAEPVVRGYCEAMLAVVQNNLPLGIEKLTAALAQKVSTAPLQALNKVMRRVLEQLAAVNATQSSSGPAPVVPADELFLGAYRQAPQQP